MNAIELLDIISAGETSKVQFKQEMDDDKFAAEMIQCPILRVVLFLWA